MLLYWTHCSIHACPHDTSAGSDTHFPCMAVSRAASPSDDPSASSRQPKATCVSARGVKGETPTSKMIRSQKRCHAAPVTFPSYAAAHVKHMKTILPQEPSRCLVASHGFSQQPGCVMSSDEHMLTSQVHIAPGRWNSPSHKRRNSQSPCGVDHNGSARPGRQRARTSGLMDGIAVRL